MTAAPALAAVSGGISALPDAPIPQNLGRIRGTVTDPSGAPMRGILVTLSRQNAATQRTVRTNRRGEYLFSGLSAGSYTVSFSSPRIEPESPTTVALGAGENYRLPMTVTPLPKVRATVVVTATVAQVAKAQVKEQEKQRVLGVIPNFNTSFVWNAAPLTPKLKFRLAARSTFDPFTIATSAAIAGVEQWRDVYPGYGTGAAGYGKRFGATYADSVDSRFIGDALLPSLFRQDPRYFYRGSGGTMKRMLYALKEAVMCRGDDGKQQVCSSHLVGDFAAAGISNVYREPGDRGFGITMRDGLVLVGGDAAENLLREFVSHHLTSHLPPGANGKQPTH